MLTRLLTAGQLVYTDPAGVATVYNGGDIAWTLASTALVWLMVPGVGFFYSGLLRRKNALSLIYLSVAVLGIVSFEVCFSGPPSSRPLMGSSFSGSSGVIRSPSATVPMHTSVTSSTLLSGGSMASRPSVLPVFPHSCFVFTSACSPPSRTSSQRFDSIS